MRSLAGKIGMRRDAMPHGLTNCNDCPLSKWWNEREIYIYVNGKARRKTVYREVPFRGSKDAELMIVGESPGAEEIEKGAPFVGASGQLSDEILRDCKIDPSKVFYANSCRCMLIKQEMSDKEVKKSLECCRPALVRAIELLKPRLILTYGDIALYQILRKTGISKKRGIFQLSKEFNTWVLPTFHPAYCIRDKRQIPFFRADILQSKRFLDGDISPDALEASDSSNFTQAESIQHILEKKDIIVAVDTETQGLDWMNPNSVVLSYSVSDDPNRGYHIPLVREAREDETPDFVIEWPRKIKAGKKAELVRIGVKKLDRYDQKVEELRELLRRSDIKKVMMNGNYDIRRFNQLGITEIRSYCLDIQLAFHLLDPDLHKQASLGMIQRILMPDRVDHKESFSEYFDKSDLLAVTLTHPKQLADYAARDAAVTLGCARILSQRMADYPFLIRYYKNLAHPVTTEILGAIEKNGIMFDIDGLGFAKEELAKIIHDTEKKFLDLVPASIKKRHEGAGCVLTRKDFLVDVFFSQDGFRLKPREMTETGKISTSKTVLKRILEEDKLSERAQDALQLYLQWSPLHKLYTTYLKGFEAAIKSDGRLHTHITKTSTATGRTSSSSPNLQNIPKRQVEIAKAIRRLLIAPPGRLLVAADYSQQELRWIAYRSRDSEFLRVYRDNDDIHTKTALILLGAKSPDEVDPDKLKHYRRSAKSVNFGFVYGMHAKKFQLYARDEYGLKITLEEAEEWRNKFFQTYRGLLEWHRREIDFARKHGYCVSPFGFMRRLPNINSSDFTARSEDERYAINTPIQSAGSDTTLLAALEVKRRGIVDDKRAAIVLFIHDELVFEVDEDYVEEFVLKLSECMEGLGEIFKRDFGFTMDVPLKSDPEVGKNLADMKPLAEVRNGL